MRRATDRVAQPAALPERPDQRHALGVDIAARAVGDVLAGPRVELAGEHAVPVLEERPVEMAGIGHAQWPSKRGLLFATNA